MAQRTAPPLSRLSRSIMKQNKIHYIVLSIIFILSFTMVLSLPSDFWKGIAATPAICALIGAFFQLFRDQAAFEKRLELQRKQQIFNLGVTSHMANTAFDKHVEFCEKYMSEVQNTVSTLYAEGPTEEIKKHMSIFFDLKIQYAAWITDEISLALDPFEGALRKIYSRAHYIEATEKDPGRQERRNKMIDEVDEIFTEMLNLENKPFDQQNPAYSVEAVKKKIRNILGIESLTSLRSRLIEEASSILDKAT